MQSNGLTKKKLFKRAIFFCLIFFISIITTDSSFNLAISQRLSVKTADPNASTETVNILKYLYSLPKKKNQRVLSGQNIGGANADLDKGYKTYFLQLERQFGKLPAILSADYGWQDIIPENISKTNKHLIRHWKKGGLVLLSVHPKNPWTKRGVKNLWLGKYKYLDIITDGTEPNKRWTSELDKIAEGLKELRDAGVVVLWRPLHEMNGNFFWWSAGKQNGRVAPEDYKKLWRHMFDYFTHKHKLNNLLWVYAPTAQMDNPLIKSVTDYYPGSEFVDVVGMDYYSNTFDRLNVDNDYDSLVSLGKPLGFTEVGPAFWWKEHPNGAYDNMKVIENIRDKHQELIFFVFYNGWSTFFKTIRMGIIENQNAQELLCDPWVINLNNMHLSP